METLKFNGNSEIQVELTLLYWLYLNFYICLHQVKQNLLY